MGPDHLPCTWFPTAYGSAGRAGNPTWEAVVARLQEHRDAPELPPACPACRRRWRRWTPCPRCGGELKPDKRSLPAWSAIVFRGGRRAEAAALAVSALVLDYDGTVPLDDLRRRWAERELVAYTTWSHVDDAAARVRVVLPFRAPVSPMLWPRVWAWAMEVDRDHDTKCGDLARLHFLPFARPGATHHAWHQTGLVLDPTKMDLPEVQRPTRRSELGATGRPNQAATRPELKTDPDARRAWMLAAGGKSRGEGDRERVVDVPCPGCERPAVWAWVRPSVWAGAGCEHRDSCGWTGWLDQLVPA